MNLLKYPVPNNEARRLEALRRYGLLDTPAEQTFDDFAQLASHICGTPIALMTLVDEDRQWFKAKLGLTVSETPREQAFCAHTIMQTDLLIVEDAQADARFLDNPLVTAEPNIRFYAGAPLIDRDGNGLGSLCVIDREPRTLSAGQKGALEVLARQLVAQCEFRRVSAELAGALGDLKTLRGLLPMCSHCKSIRGDEGYWRRVEDYLKQHSEADLSHSICPQCCQKYHPEVYARLAARGKLQIAAGCPS